MTWARPFGSTMAARLRRDALGRTAAPVAADRDA